jgi:hypothetical protein
MRQRADEVVGEETATPTQMTKFEVRNPQWEVPKDGSVSLRAVDATCSECGHTWRSLRGNHIGGFVQQRDGEPLAMSCEKCRATGPGARPTRPPQ